MIIIIELFQWDTKEGRAGQSKAHLTDLVHFTHQTSKLRMPIPIHPAALPAPLIGWPTARISWPDLSSAASSSHLLTSSLYKSSSGFILNKTARIRLRMLALDLGWSHKKSSYYHRESKMLASADQILASIKQVADINLHVAHVSRTSCQLVLTPS